ncbi:MAG TPA: sigma 54-interacting transcriptional regulator [Vicinamibacterales bacterium]
MTSIVFVGCPPSERADAEQQLETGNVRPVWADTASGALDELQRRDMPVLLDLSRGSGALQVAREIRTHRAATLMFAVVDPQRPDLATEAVLAGMADVLARPVDGRRVANAIDRERNQEARRAGGDAPPRGLSDADLYSHSTAMRDVAALVTRAAKTRSGVLILGEEGTGRQVAARAIHALQPNSAAPFVTIDCAAYGRDELDAALFGSTGTRASRDSASGLERVGRDGALYTALGGTLYLQNIAEAPSRAQARLARLLRDREAILADKGDAFALDVRPIAGVGPGVDAAVEDGSLREDLFRRLVSIRIDMPPLRSRREDIPALANHFLRDICATMQVPPKTLSRPALAMVAALPWRGNAVELRALLEAVVAGQRGGRGIGLEDLLAHVKLDSGATVLATGGTLKQARSRFERDYIAAVLDQHNGRIGDAAKALGIQRTNLYRKMRSLSVARARRQ